MYCTIILNIGEMGMGGCKHAALDCALLPFWEDAINLAFLACFYAAGLSGLDVS